MKSILDMTPAEADEERLKRLVRRAKGEPVSEPTPVERARQEAEQDERNEKAIQARVRKIFLAHGCEVYSLSQPRSTKQTPGIGDMFVIHRRLRAAFWFETKTPRGRQSPDQVVFQEALSFTPTGYVLGGEAAAWDHLRKIGAIR